MFQILNFLNEILSRIYLTGNLMKFILKLLCFNINDSTLWWTHTLKSNKFCEILLKISWLDISRKLNKAWLV
jgi:hypothetical protein